MRTTFACVFFALLGCSSPGAGRDGAPGAKGEPGPPGMPGMDGQAGKDAAQSGSRLKAQWMTGGDGSRQFWDWFDSTTAQTCAFEPATDGKTRCLPAKYYGLRLVFLDNACTMPIVYQKDINGQTPPAPAVVYAHAEEIDGDVYVKIGPPVPEPLTYYTAQMGQCFVFISSPVDKEFFYDTLGLDPAFFVEGSIVTD